MGRFGEVRLFSLRWSRGGTQWYQVPIQAQGPPHYRAVYPPPRFTVESPTLSSPMRVRTAMITPPHPIMPHTLQIQLYRKSVMPHAQDRQSPEREEGGGGGGSFHHQERRGEGSVLQDLTHQLWALTFLSSSPAFPMAPPLCLSILLFSFVLLYFSTKLAKQNKIII